MPTPWSLRPCLALLFAVSALLASPARAAGATLPPQGPAGWATSHGWVEGGVATTGATEYLNALSKLDRGLTAVTGDLPKKVVKPLADMHAAIDVMAGAKGALELGHKSATSLFPKLEAGEKRVPGITYLSYGGSSPISLRVYIKVPGAKARTVDLLSAPEPAEMHSGSGDAMVADASAHFPASYGTVNHVTQPIHHGEVLWHQPTIDAVRKLLAVRPAGY